MAKVVHCSDIGFDCEGVVRAETEQEVLRLAAEHAEKVHGVESISAAVADKVRSEIRDEPA